MIAVALEAMAELERSLRQVIHEIGRVNGDFSSDADLYNDLGLDSFRMAEIFVAIETRFAITLSEDDYIQLRSLADLMAVLDREPAA